MIGQKGIPTSFGGIERNVEVLSTRLGRLGYEVIVYTRAWYAAPNARFSPGVRTVATPTIHTKHLDAITHTLTSTFHAIFSGVDVIHYHGVGPTLLSFIPRLLAPRTKVITTFHCIDRFHGKWGWFARLMLWLGEWACCRFPHETIVTSKTLAKYCREKFGRETNIVYYGIEAPETEQGDEVIRRFGLKRDGYVAMVSRLVRHKGAHYLIAAYQELKKRGLTNGKKLALVGDSAFTDEYVASLKRLADGDPDIVFTGYLKGKALAQMFAGAYCLAHPSESEGMPIAVLEAMGYGKCVVASDIPENMEAITENGLPFGDRNVADLARALEQALANPDLVREKGAAARAYILARHGSDLMAKEVSRIYKRVAIGRPVKRASEAKR